MIKLGRSPSGFSSLFKVRFNSSSLKNVFEKNLPNLRTRFKTLQSEHGTMELQKVKVNHILNGMKDLPGYLQTTSLTDGHENLLYRGKSIDKIAIELANNGVYDQPQMEAVLFYLLTGEMPSSIQIKELADFFVKNGEISPDLIDYSKNLPSDMSPLTQLTCCLLYLQKETKYKNEYLHWAANKDRLWQFYLEDTLNLLSKLPALAGLIFKRHMKDESGVSLNPDLDFAGNISHAMGIQGRTVPLERTNEFIRAFIFCLADYPSDEMNYVMQLVSSTISDPYLSTVAGLNTLAGHTQIHDSLQTLLWLDDLRNIHGESIYSDEKMNEVISKIISEGKDVPGYCSKHHSDQRFFYLKDFAHEDFHSKAEKLKPGATLNLVMNVFRHTPVLFEKFASHRQSQWPTVSAITSTLMRQYGVEAPEFHPVLFGIAKSVGCLSNIIISRALDLKMMRPKSVSMDWLENNVFSGQTLYKLLKTT